MRRRDLLKLPALALLLAAPTYSRPAQAEGQRKDDPETAVLPLRAEWVPYADQDAPADAWTILGGEPFPLTWDAYERGWVDPATAEPYPELPRALRDACPRGVDAMEVAEGWFRLSDGRALTLSTRACGDLMAAIADRGESYTEYAFGGKTL